MGKFDFVNRGYEMLSSEGKKKSRETNRIETLKDNSLKKYIISASLSLLIASCLLFYQFAKGEIKAGISEDEGTILMAGGSVGKENRKTSDGTLPQAGLPADFKADNLYAGHNSSYKIDLKMPSVNRFTVQSKVKIANKSGRAWNEIVFYFFPNQLGYLAQQKCRKLGVTSAIDTCLKKMDGGEAEIKSVTLNGKEVKYELKDVLLRIPLEEAFKSGGDGTIGVDYSFSLPKDYRKDGMYDLLQWHPLLPEYENGQWKVQDSVKGIDSYTTPPANYEITYQLSGEHQIISSLTDLNTKSKRGTIKGESLTEMYLLLSNKRADSEVKAGNVDIRVFSSPEIKVNANRVAKKAAEVAAFFEERLGKYPYKQLDIILTKERSGSYPGLMFLPDKKKDMENPHVMIKESEEHALSQLIAQQWFYGGIQIDRSADQWLIAGLSELAASLFLIGDQQKSEKEGLAFAQKYYEYADLWIQEREIKSNQPASDYFATNGGVIGFTQAKPAIMLWRVIKPYGNEIGLRYLSDYIGTYSGKKVSTIEFIRFTQNYFKVNNGMFTDWLKFNPYEDRDFEKYNKL